MEETCGILFNLIYGELFPIESKIHGKICYIFYDVNDLSRQIIYFPSTKEIKILRNKEFEFSRFLPLHTEDFKVFLNKWMENKYNNDIRFKGINFIEFNETLYE
jgi:hypothetical protein